MPAAIDITSYERAIAAGAQRALTKRAVGLRDRAQKLTTCIDDKGRQVALLPPEAVVMLRSAALFDECAADLESMGVEG